MTLSNWIELAVLVLIIAVGTFLWQYFRRKLNEKDGFEGVFTERGKSSPRIKMDEETEIKLLQEIVNRKE